MSRTTKRPFGQCRLCGALTELTWEHTPPRAAFNNRRVVVARFNQVIGLGPDETIKGEIEQKGMGDYSLCGQCNNTTGQRYAKWFVWWCYQAFELLDRTDGKPILSYPYYLYPLATIKQIITMFFTVNQIGFGEANPELVRFVLNRDAMYLSPRYRVFVYYNVEGGFRKSGIVAAGNIGAGGPGMRVFSEMNYPPLGYVLSYDGTIPNNRLYEISHFARYAYSEIKMLCLQIPVLATHTWHPGDYRNKDEIRSDYNRNMEEMRRAASSKPETDI